MFRTSFLELHRQLANATDPVDLFYNQLADTFAQEISKNGNSGEVYDDNASGSLANAKTTRNKSKGCNTCRAQIL